MVSPKAVLSTVREKRPFLDHLIRAFGRYTADAGNRQAAAVTYFGFLSFFPMLALAASVLGFVLGPDSIRTVVDEVNGYLPGLADQLDLQDFLTNNSKAATAGVIGLAGLLYAGLGWVDVLREAVRSIWHHNIQAGNIVVKKLKDILVLVGLGGAILVSVAVSAATGAAQGFFLDLAGLEESTVARLTTYVVGLALGLLTSTLLFVFLFVRLPKVQAPLHRVARGALLAAVLFEVLKQLGGYYIGRTTSNPTYGSFAVIVGLLIWINLVSRVFLICAAWTVTAPYDSDVEPSGTASPEAAEKADVPVEFADNDPDDPPNLLEEGAPSPLAAVVEGKVPSQDVPTGRDQTGGVSQGQASSAQAQRTVGQGATAVLDDPEPKQRALVEKAGNFTAGALGMVLVAVLLHVGRTARELFRR